MNTIKKLLDALFLITMFLFLGISAVIVLGQIVAIFTLNGELSVWLKDTLVTPACIACAVTGLTAYVMSYIYHWNSDD